MDDNGDRRLQHPEILFSIMKFSAGDNFGSMLSTALKGNRPFFLRIRIYQR